ncbi:hypothetical protein [Parabacteroides faecis]|uniref:hypothetical protein n=1 Tax=Parabacteroides faecis TaxID=1217282 RepID=UPI0021665238|nr:hypothetical protein [Parabacteroides faecis]MCS2892347.1 hypothetical protein [Parabacteroides faecis]
MPAPEPVSLSLRLDVDKSNGATPNEQIHTLRLILINEDENSVEKISDEPIKPEALVKNLTKASEGENENVEHNKYIYTVDNIETTTGNKIIYAVANAEDKIKGLATGGQLSSLLGTELIEKLESLQLSGKIETTDGSIPISSRKNKFLITKKEEGTVISIDMVYAAVKFDLEIAQKVNIDKKLTIVGWGISRLASKSYLLPHFKEGEWENLLELSGTVDADKWVFGYETAEQPNEHQPEYLCESIVHDISLGNYTSPTVYWHESRSQEQVDLESNTNGCPYVLSVKVRTQDMNENTDPIILNGELPNLRSLVRSTHVKMKATIKSSLEPGDNHLEVRVLKWKENGPIDGEWEEVEDTNK